MAGRLRRQPVGVPHAKANRRTVRRLSVPVTNGPGWLIRSGVRLPGPGRNYTGSVAGMKVTEHDAVERASDPDPSGGGRTMPLQDITAAEVGNRLGATTTQPAKRGERFANSALGRVSRKMACEPNNLDGRAPEQRAERLVRLIRRDAAASDAEVDLDMDARSTTRHTTCHEAAYADLANQPLGVGVSTAKKQTSGVQNDQPYVHPSSPYSGGLNDRAHCHHAYAR